jgi:phage antirepressor YoqD-like protein
MYKDVEQTFTLAEIAAEYGITDEQLVEILIQEGLLDEEGNPTQQALDSGLCVFEEEESEEDSTESSEESKCKIIQLELWEK